MCCFRARKFAPEGQFRLQLASFLRLDYGMYVFISAVIQKDWEGPRYQVSLTSNEVSKGKASPTTNNGNRPCLALMQLLKGPANPTALIATSRTNITGRSYPSHWCTHWHLQLTRYSLCFFSCCFLSLPVAPPPCFRCPPH